LPEQIHHKDPVKQFDSRLQFCNHSADRLLHSVGFPITLVRITRPEKTSQAILPATRYNVHVQVRHTLAHAIIHRNERAVRLHSRLDRARQKLNVTKDRFNQVRGQIDQSLIMLFGDKQAMTWKDRTMIEKGQAVVVFEDDASSEFAARDFAEQT
jgi:hypothetical protein